MLPHGEHFQYSNIELSILKGIKAASYASMCSAELPHGV